jgi:hypothetical protein
VRFTNADWREPVQFMDHCPARWAYHLPGLKAAKLATTACRRSCRPQEKPPQHRHLARPIAASIGGLAFLVGGNMAISASGQGGALVRVNPADSAALIATANATLAVMGGRTMQGWLRVRSADLETDEQLTEWVNRAVAYARSLPPKR